MCHLCYSTSITSSVFKATNQSIGHWSLKPLTKLTVFFQTQLLWLNRIRLYIIYRYPMLVVSSFQGGMQLRTLQLQPPYAIYLITPWPNESLLWFNILICTDAALGLRCETWVVYIRGLIPLWANKTTIVYGYSSWDHAIYKKLFPLFKITTIPEQKIYIILLTCIYHHNQMQAEILYTSSY